MRGKAIVFYSLHFLNSQNKHVVEQLLHVVHLVGGNDDGALVGHVRGNDAAELLLRRDVETIGGLVHQQVARAAGQGERHQDLLLLTHREAADVKRLGQAELLQALAEHFLREVRIERPIGVDVLGERHRRQFELLGHDVEVLQQGALAATGVVSVDQCQSFAGMQQAHHNI